MDDIIKNFIAKLDYLQDKNDEQWMYAIRMYPDSRLFYMFSIEERADNHVWLSAQGETIEEMIKNADEYLPIALKEFGYKNYKFIK